MDGLCHKLCEIRKNNTTSHHHPTTMLVISFWVQTVHQLLCGIDWHAGPYIPRTRAYKQKFILYPTAILRALQVRSTYLLYKNSHHKSLVEWKKKRWNTKSNWLANGMRPIEQSSTLETPLLNSMALMWPAFEMMLTPNDMAKN